MIRRVFGRDARAGVVAGGSAAYSNCRADRHPADAGRDSATRASVFLIVIVAVHLPVMMLVSVRPERMGAQRRRDRDGATVPRETLMRRLAMALATHPILIGIVAGLLWRVVGLRHSAPRSRRSSSRSARTGRAARALRLRHGAGELRHRAADPAGIGDRRPEAPAAAGARLRRGARRRPAADRRGGGDADGRLPDRRQRLPHRRAGSARARRSPRTRC